MSQEPTTTLSPLAVIREAIQQVPAVKYALGVAGIAAAIALVNLFGRDTQSGFLLSILVAGGMVVLYIFSTLAANGGLSVVIAGHVLVWTVIVPFVVLVGASTWAFIDGRPCNWAELLALKQHRSCSSSSTYTRVADGGLVSGPSSGGNWVTITGQFLATTPRSRPEDLAKQTARALQNAGRGEPVQIYRGITGGQERNIVVVRAGSQSDANTLAELARSAGVGNSDAVSWQNSNWTKVADCNVSGCTW